MADFPNESANSKGVMRAVCADSSSAAPAVCEPACEPQLEALPNPAQPFQELPEPGRNTDGTFAPGNVFALRHGGHSRSVVAGALEGQQEALAALVERRAAIEADLGGRDNLSTLQLDLVQRYVELSLINDWLMGNVLEKGAITEKGAQRAALTAALGVQGQLIRVAEKLGFQRLQKNPQTASDYLVEKRAERERAARENA